VELALTREVSRNIAACQLSFIERQPVDYARAAAQHDDYCATLKALGLELLRLPADDALPDCCFVEDTAVVLDELAIVTRMGSSARRGETPAVEQALSAHRALVIRMDAPATLDGGDVLRVGRTLFVGVSKRSNGLGAEVLRLATAKHGYTTVPVEVRGCLHLKSAVGVVDDATLIANPIWVDPKAFPGVEVLSVPSREPSAANLQRVGGSLLLHAGFPQTIEALARRGHSIRAVDVSEFLKCEAGVTCKSIVFRKL
jgi:dimethylargininase